MMSQVCRKRKERLNLRCSRYLAFTLALIDDGRGMIRLDLPPDLCYAHEDPGVLDSTSSNQLRIKVTLPIIYPHSFACSRILKIQSRTQIRLGCLPCLAKRHSEISQPVMEVGFDVLGTSEVHHVVQEHSPTMVLSVRTCSVDTSRIECGASVKNNLVLVNHDFSS